MNVNSWLTLYYYNFASCVFLLQTKNETIVEAGESSMARDLNYTHYYKVWSNLILTAIVPIGGHHVLLNSWIVKWVTWLNWCFAWIVNNHLKKKCLNFFLQVSKGQLTSECLFGVLNFPKKQRKNLANFCPRK